MRIPLLLLFLLTVFNSRADYWDNLTHDEAVRVVAELKQNPFIFKYCDCCGHSLELVKVLNTEIIPCSWLEGAYSVRYTYQAIVSFMRPSKIGALENPEKYIPEETSELIYMNYTWTLNPEIGKAAAFFTAVPYDYYDNSMCSEAFDYPKPKEIKPFIKGTGYKKWYVKNISI